MRAGLSGALLAIALSVGACGTRRPVSLTTVDAHHRRWRQTGRRPAGCCCATDLPGYDVGNAADADPVDLKPARDFEACAATAHAGR